jgi:hypothetical protein
VIFCPAARIKHRFISLCPLCFSTAWPTLRPFQSFCQPILPTRARKLAYNNSSLDRSFLCVPTFPTTLNACK